MHEDCSTSLQESEINRSSNFTFTCCDISYDSGWIASLTELAKLRHICEHVSGQ